MKCNKTCKHCLPSKGTEYRCTFDNETRDIHLGDECMAKESNEVRSHNVGNSDYSKHKIQPWDIWIEYKLNPFDGDILKRILRKKKEHGMSEKDARRMDYEKIIHICQERIRQIDEGLDPWNEYQK